MPKRADLGSAASESNVADHVRRERERRGWSTGELARRVTEAGCALSQSAVWRIESGEPRRKISVDELVAFARVFERSIDELLAPVSLEVPASAVRLYVNKWVDSETELHRHQVRVGIDLRRLIAAAWFFPASVDIIPDLISERVKEVMGMSDAREYLARFEKELRTAREQGGSYLVIDPTELILLGRSEGKTDEEILNEASRWGVHEAVEETLRVGVVHYVEPGFAGYIPLEFMVIRDGRVAPAREVGSAVIVTGRHRAKEAGLPQLPEDDSIRVLRK